VEVSTVQVTDLAAPLRAGSRGDAAAGLWVSVDLVALASGRSLGELWLKKQALRQTEDCQTGDSLFKEPIRVSLPLSLLSRSKKCLSREDRHFLCKRAPSPFPR